MALSGYEHLIPFDEAMDKKKDVADRIHNELRCAKLGGLSITKAVTKIGQTLIEQQVFSRRCWRSLRDLSRFCDLKRTRGTQAHTRVAPVI